MERLQKARTCLRHKSEVSELVASPRGSSGCSWAGSQGDGLLAVSLYDTLML